MGVETTFLILGGIIVAGFFSQLFFQKTKIPDVILLLLLGVLMGPVFGVVQAEPLVPMMAFIGALALIILTFDGGLNLNFFKVLTELSKATIFTLLIFTLSTLATAAFATIVLEWQFIHGLLLGVVIGGSSAGIVLPIMQQLTTSEEAKTILKLESVISDALCVVGAITILQIIASDALNISEALHGLSSNFSIAVVIAMIFGLVWIGALRQFYGKSLGYLLTLAVVFLLYGFVEYVGGNGVIAALVFGVILGNAGEIAQMLRMQGDFLIDRSIKAFQTEVSFFVKTFFFVYLGLIFNLDALNSTTVIVSFGIVAALLFARYVGVKIFTDLNKSLEDSRIILTSMFPRGLAAAVLASLPFTQGIHLEGFADIVFLVIILTNVVATIGAFIYERSRPPEEEKPEAEKPKEKKTEKKTEKKPK